MKKGFFLVLEGVEGTGKSTLALFLKEKLEEKGFKVFLTREPGGTDCKVAEEIRKVILDKNNNVLRETEAYLFAASRAQHIREIIIPHLEKGEIVICDRFVYSSYAYQGEGRGIGIEKVRELNKLALNGVKPDLVIYLDLDPKRGLERKRKARQDFDRLDEEGIKFHQKVRKGYLKLIKKEPKLFKVIDVSKPLEEVKKEVLEVVLKNLKEVNYGSNRNY